jgi:hypothetical protein
VTIGGTLDFLWCSCSIGYMLNLSSLTVQQLERAVAIKQQIESLQHELESLGASEGSAITTKGNQPKRATGITDGRGEILKRAREAKSAKQKASKEITVSPASKPVTVAKPQRRKRGPMSAEQKAKLAEAGKARWAKSKAAEVA